MQASYSGNSPGPWALHTSKQPVRELIQAEPNKSYAERIIQSEERMFEDPKKYLKEKGLCWKYLPLKSPCRTNGLISKIMNARCLQLLKWQASIALTSMHGCLQSWYGCLVVHAELFYDSVG